MKILPFVAALVLLAACSSNPAISKQLAGTDSVVVNFNYPQTNNIMKSVASTEDFAIEKLTRLVAAKTIETNKCGNDGNCLFYKNGALLGNVSFNYSTESCRHFAILLDNKLTNTSMDNEAADYLKSLR